MLRYTANRVLQFIPTILGIYILAFFMMRVLPGDPAQYLQGDHGTQESLDNLRRTLRLDEPLINQFGVFLGNALQGDLGQSFITHQPVTVLIQDAFGPTAILALSAMMIAVVVGVPLGIVSAVRKNSLWDNFSRLISLAGVSIPVFWLGLQLQIIFGLQVPILPISGAGYDQHLILPAVSASLGMLALLTRMTRSSLLDVLNQDYIRTASGKGLTQNRVIQRHALPNALLPVVTVWGTGLAGLLSGTILVEVIFSWPGMGRLLVQSISTRDYPTVQGLVITFALIYAGLNLLVDLLYPLIDPRIRYDNG
jgi:ABC-type dipeptide/oligopeptide/nickel transport system permease component